MELLNSSDNFDFEIYKSSMLLDSTETFKIKDYNKRNNNYPLLVLLAGSLSLSTSCDASKLKENIRSESVYETETLDNFLENYDININSPISRYFDELADKIPQRKISKKDIIRDIISFESLKLNWDGYGAYPLEVESAANAIELINLLHIDAYSQIDQMYPNPNGTISLVWNNKFDEEISIEIGNKTMSYYIQMCSQETIYKNNIKIDEFEAAKISEHIITMV